MTRTAKPSAKRPPPPPPPAPAPLPPALAQNTVTVYSCVGGGPMQRLADALADAGLRARVHSLYSPEGWRALMAAGRLGRLRARLSALALYPVLAAADAWRRQPTFCVPTTNPFLLPAVLVATRPLHGRRVVPLVYDLYPDAFEVAVPGRLARLVGRLGAHANRAWFRAADGLVFIGPAMAAHAEARYGAGRRTLLAETGAAASEFAPAALGPAEPESELERFVAGRVVFSYVGNLGHVHDVETLAAALPELARRLPPEAPWAIVVAASGSGVAPLRAACAALPADRVRFVPPLEDRPWARLLARSAVSLVTLHARAAHTSIPSKTFSAMAAGNAVVAVAPAGSDLAAVVGGHGLGAVVAPGDVAGLVAAMARLVAEPDWRAQCQANARRALAAHYDMPQLARRYATFLDGANLPPPRQPVRRALKRAIDCGAGALAVGLAAPVLAGVAAAIRLSMGAPVLFRQQRPGEHGRPFEVLKFRTMRAPRPGETGPDADEARLTRLGRFLRKTSLDELPTLLNVLRGDLSLVGPRPLLMRYLERYTPQQARRHEVRPGITGYAQVHGRNALSWPDKFALDVCYVDNWSLRLDFRILRATVAQVLRRTGIEHPGHATMPEFMGLPPEENPA